MALPGYTHGVRVRVLGKLHGQDCIQVLHFGTNTEVNDNPARDVLILQLLTAILACITEQLLDAVTSEYTLVGLEGTEVFPTLGDPIFHAAPPNTVGTRGPTSASFIATLIQVRTGFGGRTHRGRNFWPPAGEADTNVSLLSGDVMTQLAAFVTCIAGKFIGDTATEPWRLGVYSKKNGPNPATQWSNGFKEASQMVPTNLVAEMGTRKVGRGS